MVCDNRSYLADGYRYLGLSCANSQDRYTVLFYAKVRDGGMVREHIDRPMLSGGLRGLRLAAVQSLSSVASSGVRLWSFHYLDRLRVVASQLSVWQVWRERLPQPLNMSA